MDIYELLFRHLYNSLIITSISQEKTSDSERKRPLYTAIDKHERQLRQVLTGKILAPAMYWGFEMFFMDLISASCRMARRM